MKNIRFWRRNLTIRLICSFLLFSLVIVSLVGLIVYYQASQSITSSVYARLDAVTTLKEDSLNNWVDDQTQNVVMVAGVPGIRRQSALLLSSAEGSGEQQRAYDELSSFLPEMVSRSVYMDEIFIVTMNGTVVVSTDKAHERQSVAEDPFFTGGRSRTYTTTVFAASSGTDPVILIATPLFDMQGKRIGVLASQIALTHTDRIVLERTGLGKSGETYLVDPTGTVVSETLLMEDGLASRIIHSEGIDAALRHTDGSGMYRNYASIPVIGVYHWVDNQNVAMLTEMSQEEAFASARDLAFSILSIGILLSLILAAGMYLLARQIARPILEIADTAARVSAGDLGRKAPVLTEDEVGQLARAFNRMTDTLGKTREGLEENLRELKAKDEELHRLNTELEQRVLERTAELRQTKEAFQRANVKLNLLSSITRHDILNQLTALKGYLELSELSSNDPGLLQKYHEREMKIADSIQHQILFTREYQDIGVKDPLWQDLTLSLIRAKGRLDLGKVSVTLDRTDLEIYADPLFDKVFYNLIDNALTYGGETLTTLRITTRESGDGLVITCEDDGEGISAKDKKRLFERGYGRHTGLGLYLCREILQITGISIDETSAPGSGARFEIHVPKGAYRIKSDE